MRAFNILSLVLVTKLFLNGDASSTPRMRIVGDESDTQEERVSKALNNLFERLMERAGKAYDESLAEALYAIGGLKEISEKPVNWIDQMLKNEDYKWNMIAILLYHKQHSENLKADLMIAGKSKAEIKSIIGPYTTLYDRYTIKASGSTIPLDKANEIVKHFREAEAKRIKREHLKTD